MRLWLGSIRQTWRLALALWLVATVASAQTPKPGIQLSREKRTSPPQDLFVVTLDLNTPQLAVRVSPGGPDPDGPGEFQTTLMTVRAVAERDHYDVAVNGDFFRAKRKVDAQGRESGYLAGLWAKLTGSAMTDGARWAVADNKLPALIINRAGRARIARNVELLTNDCQMVSGHPMLVEEGKALPLENKTTHPRTAVGVDATGRKLILLIVDGRNPTVATGMTLAELARELLRLGCVTAFNLDGGGSTTLVIRDAATGKLLIANHPSDHRERPVANVLGIRVGGSN
jgi:exopolysaccharide biosynthesis protein